MGDEGASKASMGSGIMPKCDFHVRDTLQVCFKSSHMGQGVLFG
jgi:hypothetical protein